MEAVVEAIRIVLARSDLKEGMVRSRGMVGFRVGGIGGIVGGRFRLIEKPKDGSPHLS